VHSFCRHGPFDFQVGDDTFYPGRVADGDLGPAFEQLRQAPGFFVLELHLSCAEVSGWKLPPQLLVLHLQMAGFAFLVRDADLGEDAQAVEPANGAGSQTENRVFSS
jgi:hypothetical protein